DKKIAAEEGLKHIARCIVPHHAVIALCGERFWCALRLAMLFRLDCSNPARSRGSGVLHQSVLIDESRKVGGEIPITGLPELVLGAGEKTLRVRGYHFAIFAGSGLENIFAALARRVVVEQNLFAA